MKHLLVLALLLPAVAAGQSSVTFGPATWAYGPNMTIWKTDVVVANPWPSPVRLDIYLGDEFVLWADLEPFEAGTIQNVVASAGREGSHLLRLESAYALDVHARTVNVHPDGSSYGAVLPELTPIVGSRRFGIGGDQYARRAVYVAGEARVDLFGCRGEPMGSLTTSGVLVALNAKAGLSANVRSVVVTPVGVEKVYAFVTVTNERTNAPEVYP